LTDIEENGSYVVSGTLDSFSSVSNALPVRLLTNETLGISSDATIICNTGDLVNISTSSDLTGETFRWMKDGVAVVSNSPTLAVNEAGTYQLIVEKYGCDLKSNTVAILPLDEGLVSLSTGNDEIVFPEGGS